MFNGMFVPPHGLTPLLLRLALRSCLLPFVPALFILAVFVLGCAAANAAEGGGKESGGLYVKIVPFTVNLHDLTQFLQVTMTLKVSNPALVKTVKANMPIILNELTYLLSDKNASQFESPADKQMLRQQARSAINKVLALTVKDGVTEVFLESLIIQ